MDIKRLQRRHKTIRKRQSALYSEIQGIKEQLQGICDHSETTPYVWEHDNGYGRQSSMAGVRCVFCGWLDFYNRGNFVDPKNVRD